MEAANSALVRSLLVERRTVALGVLVDGKPYVGQLPFAPRADFGALFVHASQLARHSRGLQDGAPFSGLIQAAETPGDDPFQIPRLMLRGTVRHLAAGGGDYSSARDVYLSRLPSGEVTFSLGDFRLFELLIEQARLVAGFGSTVNLTPGALMQVAAGDDDSGEARKGLDS
jgi:hypothetical protein